MSGSGWDRVAQRAQQHAGQCRAFQSSSPGVFTGFDTRSIVPFHNDTVASLPAFGIVEDLEVYNNNNNNNQSSWPVCTLPPNHECLETQFSVVFMAYNPDRLGITLKEIQRLLNPTIFQNWVYEIILVWNGERHVNESTVGQELLHYSQTHPVRIVYPLNMGFPNDLMNRYHPDVVQPQTKALLYYDDDGPFYSPAAIQGGFELWKRHAHVQVGAMARQLKYSPRQEQERWNLVNGGDTTPHGHTNKHRPDDTQFVSHCTNLDDAVDYNFHYFANYDANMVLPSGSFLHANYLCYLWHPILNRVRQFVQDHPVHPDDMTVSMVVSQLAGQAPRVYSRRLNPAPDHNTVTATTNTKTTTIQKQNQQQQQPQRRRRLSQHDYNPVVNQDTATSASEKDYGHDNKYLQQRPSRNGVDRIPRDKDDYHTDYSTTHDNDDNNDNSSSEYYDDNNNVVNESLDWGLIPQSELQRHRSLLFSICWDCGAGMTELKQYWAELRTEAVNALVQYFGSLNSGSLGWCAMDSTYYDASVDGRCHPVMAKQGWLPWMNADGTPKETCP